MAGCKELFHQNITKECTHCSINFLGSWLFQTRSKCKTIAKESCGFVVQFNVISALGHICSWPKLRQANWLQSLLLMFLFIEFYLSFFKEQVRIWQSKLFKTLMDPFWSGYVWYPCTPCCWVCFKYLVFCLCLCLGYQLYKPNGI